MSEVNIGRTVDLGAVSAYAIAVEHGYRGTEAEWIAEWDIVRQEAQAAEEALGAGVYSVRYNAPQTLTDAQKTQARENIDGASTDNVASVQSLIVGGIAEKTPDASDIASGVWAKDNSGKGQRTSSADYISPNSPGIDISDFVVGGQLVVYASLVSNYGAFILDADGNVIGDKYITANHLTVDGVTYTASGNPANVGPITFIIPEGAKYLAIDWRVAYYNDSYSVIKGTVNGISGKVDNLTSRVNMAESNISAVETEIDGFVRKETSIGVNLYNPNAATPGFIQNAQGSIVDSASYITSDFIPVRNGEPIIVSRIRDFLAYTANKSPIEESYTNVTTTAYVYTPTQDGFIRASLFVSEENRNQIAYGDTLPAYVPYTERTEIEDNIHLSPTMLSDVESEIKNNVGDVLSGKKWVACGDSFTAGSFSASLTNDYTFTDGPYLGENKVYPFFIGRRNPTMTVINEAISGSQMSAGGTNPGDNAFSQTRYLNIPDDADYITLMFGINDAGHSVPIGTIDDTTNTTFYGAWNVVLEYLTTHHPFAHIGIIVGPGMQTVNGNEKANAEIEIAKKWGIPYLNIQYESGGGKIPLMLRTSNPDVAQTVKNACNNRQYVNPSNETPNYHPNEFAHEFESTFIEAWLRTL